MSKSTFKIALFVCIACIIMVGTCLLFSTTLASRYSNDLAVFNSSGEKLNQLSNSFEYSDSSISTISETDTKKGDELAVFEYENIDFVSYSEYWDTAKLEDLAHELFMNVHGEEITYVARVELHDDNYDEYAGLHRTSYEKHSLPIRINNLLPNKMTLDFSALSSVIVLTGANENTTIESMARTLSHEYGHHYTKYHFGLKGTITDMAGKYASLRKERGAPIYSVVTDWDEYISNHMWDLLEIAAEDYVFLMGSPLTKKQVDYFDNQELADLYSKNKSKYQAKTIESIISYNSYPHENPILASPSQVKGLAEYYYSFVGTQAPTYTQVSDYGTLDMNFVQTATSSYAMTWSKPWQYDNITYTLVAYDTRDDILGAIKTISGNEEALAAFGEQKVERNYVEYSVNDLLDTLGSVRFRIIVTFADDSIVVSDPYDVRF